MSVSIHSIMPGKAVERPRKKRVSEKKVLKKVKSIQDKNKRLHVINALSTIKRPWIGRVLSDCLDDPSEQIRDRLLSILGSWDNLDVDRLYPRLNTPPWYVKSIILKLLGNRQEQNAIPHIARLIYESNADVRKTMAETLGQLKGKKSLALLAVLLKDQNQFVRAAAEKAIKAASEIRFTPE
ncbi:MAG: HEAT repeat domain-containing protein [Candidatus Aminicenantes bacterium]|nr:HEAT repeat domain-containing protein [Candidatus Aminicenantes bacterium]